MHVRILPIFKTRIEFLNLQKSNNLCLIFNSLECSIEWSKRTNFINYVSKMILLLINKKNYLDISRSHIN